MLLSRSVKTQLGVAFIFILLGTGNILFGEYKSRFYSSLIHQAASELSRSDLHVKHASHSSALLFPTLNIDQQAKHINNLKTRHNYYRFVILGGKCFLAIAGLFLLTSFLSLTNRQEPVL